MLNICLFTFIKLQSKTNVPTKKFPAKLQSPPKSASKSAAKPSSSISGTKLSSGQENDPSKRVFWTFEQEET
jgi:hypothetical protein